MRSFFALLLLLLLPFSAWAQTETVSVTAMPVALAGAWIIRMPAARQGFGAGFGPMRNFFCRLKGPAAVYCFDRPSVGLVTRQDRAVQIVWGTMLWQSRIDATVDSMHTFTGRYAARLFGVTIRAPATVTARRRAHLENVPDAGGQSALLAQFLRAGARNEPPPLPVAPDVGLPTGKELRALGAVQRLIHMGRADDAAQVYAVQFAEDLRLCALRQRQDGVVDQLRCI